MATEQAAPGNMTLDRSDGSATIDLYRAALGPVHTDGYLRAFTRFDAAGKSGPSWNWTAALLTLNWMLFRKLWAAALAYVGVLAGSLLLLFGIGRLLFQLPETGQWSLLALAVLLAFAVPGVYGNAWLYAACNKAMARALAASASLEEAAALLRKRASGRPRLAGLAVGNVALAGAVAAAVMSFMHSGALPFNTSQLEQARAEGPAVSGLATQSMASAETAAASAPAVAASVPSLAASAAAAAAAAAVAAPAAPSRSSQGLVQPATALLAALAPAATASHAATVASAPAAAQAVASAPTRVAASAPAAVVSAPALVASKVTASASAVETPAKPTKEELHAKALLAKQEKLAKAKETKVAQAAKDAEAKVAKAKTVAATASAAKASKASAPAVAASAPSDKYLINVGLFADPNNARNAYTKLQDAGIPASIKELKSAKGPQTRVRAGPFDSEAEAEAAAEKIRALRLEAAVIKP